MNEGGGIAKINTLKSEHLAKGVKPIIVCIGAYSDFDNRPIERQLNSSQHKVDYYERPTDLEKRNFLNAGNQTYVISLIDNLDKFSYKFFDCTGLVVTGIDKKTGKNISFLSHQDPTKFLNSKKDEFIEHLRQRLTEIKSRCKNETIDAVIVGGKYPPNPDLWHKSFIRQDYLDSIKLLSLNIQQTLGFEPVVINGPKIESSNSKEYDNIYYDTENRRLYFMRPEVNPTTGSFTHSNIDKEKNKWEKNKLTE